jgi:hypothetical protein
VLEPLRNLQRRRRSQLTTRLLIRVVSSSSSCSITIDFSDSEDCTGRAGATCQVQGHQLFHFFLILLSLTARNGGLRVSSHHFLLSIDIAIMNVCNKCSNNMPNQFVPAHTPCTLTLLKIFLKNYFLPVHISCGTIFTLKTTNSQ